MKMKILSLAEIVLKFHIYDFYFYWVWFWKHLSFEAANWSIFIIFKKKIKNAKKLGQFVASKLKLFQNHNQVEKKIIEMKLDKGIA
jgi:hypothetical protein